MIRRAGAGAGIGALLLAAIGCGGKDAGAGQRERPSNRSAAPFVAPAETTVFRGVYRRDRESSAFRLCGTPWQFRVSADDSVFDYLDANVDWHAPRPTTTVFAQVSGDTTSAGADSSIAGTLTVVTIDSTRDLDGGECVVQRAETPPPPNAARVSAAMRAALGADSARSRPRDWGTGSAWLNGDMRPDLLVLVRTPALCERRGCQLFAFEGTRDGYRLISRTISVVGPVQRRPERVDGWHHIQAKVNQGAFGLRDVLLMHRHYGYPPDADVAPGLRGRRTAFEDSVGTVVIR